MAKLYFRLDDIAPNMNWDNFNRLVYVFKKYGVKPLLAIIPDNQDAELLKYPFSREFSTVISNLKRDGWIIAQHGYKHVCENQNGGVLSINSKGEFAGLDFETQKRMLENGKKIIEEKFGDVNIFVAPAHSFDKNTAMALKINGFKYISDGIALYPFRKWGIIWLPQILWWPRKIWFGTITVVLHPNTMEKEEFGELENFIKKNRYLCGNFSDLMQWREEVMSAKLIFTFIINQFSKLIWYVLFWLKADRPMAEKYINAEAYDKRAESSVLENYVLGLWQPFLKDKIAKISPNKVVVDWGCGTGEYALAAGKAKKIYCTDISGNMLKKAKEKLKNFNQVEFICSNGFKSGIPNGVGEVVLTIGVWEYVNPELLFKELKRLTKKGSQVMVVFPNIYNDLNWMRSLVKIKKVALRPGYIKNLFSAHGGSASGGKKDFRLIESASFGAVSWFPKKLQFLILPIWKFCDFIWSPFQKFLPLGINVYYLFERK